MLLCLPANHTRTLKWPDVLRAHCTRYLPLLVLFSLGSPAIAAAAVIAVNGITSNCEQTSTEELDCDFRSPPKEPLNGVAASMEGLTLPAPITKPYPSLGDTSAVMILLDISTKSPMDELTLAIKQITDRAKPHHRLGLTTYSGQIGTALPIGTEPKNVGQAAIDLISSQQPSSRYRDFHSALKTLTGVTATRKAVIFVTHAQLTPDAYYADELLNTAHTGGIHIYVLIPAASAGNEQGLAALTKLSLDTGGTLLRLPTTGEGPSDAQHSVADQIYGLIDAGTRFTVDLKSASRAGIVGARQVTISLTLPERNVNFMVPVSLGSPPVPPRNDTRMDSASEANVTIDESTDWMSRIATLSVLTFAVFLFKSAWRREPSKPKLTSKAISEALRAAPTTHPTRLPSLRRLGSQGEQHHIEHSPWRIGRGEDNDLVLEHNSVSRNHAEIVRRADNSYAIQDLNSLNGVFVNNKKNSLAALSDGDQVDIGDVRFQFSSGA